MWIRDRYGKYSDPGSGMEKIWIRGGKIRIRDPDKHPGSATLFSL